MSLAKLTSQSTQTLSLLLERQRLQTLPSFAPAAPGSSASTTSNLHLPQISRNLYALRAGIIELGEKEGVRSEAVRLLRSQYERMRGMLPLDVQQELGIERLEEPQEERAPSVSRSPSPPPIISKESSEHIYAPYTDDPEAQRDPSEMLLFQRQMMDEQDTHLDNLSHSVTRQHHISLQINDELDTHTGLLEALDTDLDHTERRLGAARRRLARVAKGVKGNVSTVTIALLIVVLLILIIVFKT